MTEVWKHPPSSLYASSIASSTFGTRINDKIGISISVTANGWSPEVSTIADLFVLCSGRSERQVQAIADAIVEKAKEAGRQPFGIEGYGAGRWVLIDLGDVVVHAFVPEERQLYRLERLWGDAPVVLRIA